jgi:hypothetical protein
MLKTLQAFSWPISSCLQGFTAAPISQFKPIEGVNLLKYAQWGEATKALC